MRGKIGLLRSNARLARKRWGALRTESIAYLAELTKRHSLSIRAGHLIRNGLSADSAFRVIEEARGRQVPDTPEQRQWVERYSSRFGSAGK